MNVGQADITTAKFECQLFVVDAQLMQYRGMDVVDLQWVFCNRISKLVRLPECRAASEAATGDEDAVAVDVVISPAGF